MAKAAPDASDHLASGELQPFYIAAVAAGAADGLPKREGFSRGDDESIESLGGQAQIDDLIDLQMRVAVAEATIEERLVAVTDQGQFRAAVAGKMMEFPQVLEPAPGLELDHPEGIHPRKVTQAFSFDGIEPGPVGVQNWQAPTAADAGPSPRIRPTAIGTSFTDRPA